ncbi:MAG: DUF885 domain-containing protein [Thermoplasmata archaeon]|jgi:uncharacterized protein (DUF885 family)|nr:DUF885 domain-containing protein [Thermoplasmata archaeon]
MQGITRFGSVAEALVDEALSWDPVYSTQLGWRKYDSLLGDPSEDGIRRQVDRMKALLVDLKTIPESELTPDEDLDRDLAIYLFENRIFELEELRQHAHMSVGPGRLADGIFFLFVREHIPLEMRFDAITARLERAPEFLEMAKRAVTDPYAVWNSTALDTGEGLIHFLDLVVATAEAKLGQCARTAKLKAAVKKASEALAHHNEWLKRTVSGSSRPVAALDRDRFERLLSLRDFGVNADEALAIAETQLTTAKRIREEVARRISPMGGLDGAIMTMRSDHPKSFEDIMRAYRDSIQKARDFVVAKRLVSIPEGEKLLVMETPHFMRKHAPFAAQFEPARFANDRTGLFMITPDGGDPAALMEHSYPIIANTTVHEAYPGHHLQGVCAVTNPSMIRGLCGSADFAEGWALYCEELMISEGYNATDMGRLAQLNDLIFRIVRVVAEVRLSRGEMTVEQAAEMLHRETGMDMKPAMDEARSYTHSPTYYMAYYIGKLAIMQLREDAEKALGPRFSLEFFHDSLVNAGCMPMTFMRRALALRMWEKHGVYLGPQTEPLAQFAKRMSAQGRV